MKRIINLFGLSLICLLSLTSLMGQSDPTALEVVKKADEKAKGLSSKGEIKMTIIRPTWTREMTMKTWTKGDDYSLILVTAPARDQGTAFLKRKKEIWNWQPTIDRVIKLPPSMMTQSWMGSDFTNDDLVKQSSIVTDYDHTLLASETIQDYECYKIQMIPHDDAVVVWGKVIMWISKKEYLQLKTEFYDEDGYLINTIIGKDIKKLGGKLLPATMEVIPADEEGHKTVIEQLWLDFDTPMKENFFSIRSMKRVK